MALRLGSPQGCSKSGDVMGPYEFRKVVPGISLTLGLALGRVPDFWTGVVNNELKYSRRGNINNQGI